MPAIQDIRRLSRVTARGVRATASGTVKASRWVKRNVGSARKVGGAGNPGMMRLLDLHAVSCAGDTLVTIGLAGTIFFSVPAGEARDRVALYLLITMVPFALLAPVVGPVLDRFRHGRRFALSATMLGRAALAWVIAANITGFGLYPAAFGVLALSRAYGVARSAAVPRLLPPGLGLSQAGARASVFGTVAGAVVAPIGALAFGLGAAWPLRIAAVIFAIGAMLALTLPPRADSDPPEVAPRIFQLPWRHRENGERVLSGPLVVATLVSSAGLRALYGFLLLFLAFAIRAGDAPVVLLGGSLNQTVALALVGGTLALGTFLSTAIGSGLKIRRPVRLQAFWLAVAALAGLWAAIRFSFGAILLFCLAAALASGLAKLAVDASIQERIPDTVRASAFAHAETLLMLAWVAGGAAGLVPVGGRTGVVVAALLVGAAAVRAVLAARRLRGDVLAGRVRSPRAVPTGRVAPAARTGPPPAAPAPTAPPAAQSSTLDTALDPAPPGYHVFQPSTRDTGITDPRSG